MVRCLFVLSTTGWLHHSDFVHCVVIAGELVMPSGTNQSGKVLQNKSQFRTIAPKIVPKVLTSRVLSCPSPSVSDRVNPGSCASTTPREVPAQNYALMQVAGQKGTFSLVALPHVASAQPIQKPRLPLPENLKLPIPRYQPPRKNKGARKKPVLSSSESGCSKPLAQSQTSPPPPDHPEVPAQPSPSKPVLSLDQAPASATMAAPTREGGHGDSQPPVTNGHGDPNLPDTPTSSTPEEPSARQGVLKISGKENFAAKETSSKPSAVVGANPKGPVDLAKGTVRCTPALVGSALQLVPSVPKGKLPILPYARMRTTKAYQGGSDVKAVPLASPGLRAECSKTSSITEGLDASTGKASMVPGPQESKQSPCGSVFCPATKLDLNPKAKRNSGSTKRKGRKLKVPDEILTFQGKRRKCKRIKTDSQEPKEQKPGVVKKYRSIMPKPVIVVPALAALASPAAVLPSQRPSSLGQDVVLNSPLSPKYLGGKQDSGPCPKPSSAFRNGFSGVKKPWHRCPICSHHFQFKQHLRDHMNTHTNRRPYSCRICRKAYVRSGSLSTHMKLHHGENRLKKLVCCEFCAKVFGHVRVYFGHLKEVHRVVISTEPSHNELQPGDVAKDRDRDVNVHGVGGPVHRWVLVEWKPSDKGGLHLGHRLRFQIQKGESLKTSLRLRFHEVSSLFPSSVKNDLISQWFLISHDL